VLKSEKRRRLGCFDYGFRKAEEQNGEMMLDVSDLNAGVYFLRITTENGVTTKKIIKN